MDKLIPLTNAEKSTHSRIVLDGSRVIEVYDKLCVFRTQTSCTLLEVKALGSDLNFWG